MDKLEEYIRKNREDLDKHIPSSGIWKSIRKRMVRQRSPLIKLLSVAAMVIVVFTTAVVLNRSIRRNSKAGNNITMDQAELIANPHLKETEIYYNNLMNSLYREATPLLTANPEIERELNIDISGLDSIGSEIKKDLKDNVDNQEVVEALIQNYRIKIKLLEEMLSVLKEDENNAKKNKNYEL